MRRPADPVAAWLLRRHPDLQPSFAAPSIVAMLRARSAMIDDLVATEVARARRQGTALHYRGVGGGFDARWYRLRPSLEGLASHHELEDPEVLRVKEQALADSTFAGHWGAIQRDALTEAAWAVPPSDAPTLVVLEGVAVRLGVDGLVRLLTQIREDRPRATVLVDLPGMIQTQPTVGAALAVGSNRSRWTSAAATGAASLDRRRIRRLGWSVRDDLWMAGRPELRAPSGLAICSGVEAYRILRLVPGPR